MEIRYATGGGTRGAMKYMQINPDCGCGCNGAKNGCGKLKKNPAGRSIAKAAIVGGVVYGVAAAKRSPDKGLWGILAAGLSLAFL